VTQETKFDVLVVDDDAAIRGEIVDLLEEEGHRVQEAQTADRAFDLMDGGAFDVVLLDINMPGTSGLDALVQVRERSPDTAVVMVTGEATIPNAMKAGQRGAFDFIEKPPDFDLIKEVVKEAGRTARMRRKSAADSVAADVAAEHHGILGNSTAIQALREQIRKVAPSQGRVLITGENGSGKELVAQAIHSMSPRAAGPFVKLNCAAIPRDLVESELFGHERGAFTGAVAGKKGRIELADRGTLLLDEVGDLAADAQAKLLRAIETGEVERVGGTKTARFDVRVIGATNKDLARAVEDGDFRQDLYYRLNVVPIHVPPLRERRTDVALLATYFLERFCEVEGKPIKRIADDARQVLEDYHWPGNVRELRNLMERAAILVDGDTVTVGDLTPWLESTSPRDDGVGLRGEVERREAEAIRRALESANWVVTQAAAGLGIDRTNLHRKMRKYGISRR